MTVGVVTDSSACITADLADEHDIAVVPISVNIDGRARGAHEVPREELLDRLRADADVSTSAPSPGAFLEAIDAVDHGEGVVVLSLARSMSSTGQAATLAASQSGADARVVDTGTAAGGVGLVALEAARTAEDGAGVDEVVSRAEQVADQVRLIAAVGSLERLVRSGRVPQLAGKAADAIGVRPLFEFRNGEPHVLRPSLSSDATRERLLERWRSSRPGGPARLHVVTMHADDPGAANELLAELRDESDPELAFVAEFDAGMLVHTGRDLLGLAWWWG